jgi:hypothetical protein
MKNKMKTPVQECPHNQGWLELAGNQLANRPKSVLGMSDIFLTYACKGCGILKVQSEGSVIEVEQFTILKSNNIKEK